MTHNYDQYDDWFHTGLGGARSWGGKKMGFLADRMRRRVAVSALALVAALPAAASADPMRIAFGDIATIETLGLLIAIERAKEQGVEVEPTFLKSEDIAAQAVVSGRRTSASAAPMRCCRRSRRRSASSCS
ncbi:hypothetical protein [Paracoccus niistensis]|uniref:ABC-type glycine betaine transport system substrate-binding domain-containing protein n=1 Tax=Paracoccus niistensis TaxID=632935 RepID=A0ABV6I0R5_9RHOB